MYSYKEIYNKTKIVILTIWYAKATKLGKNLL